MNIPILIELGWFLKLYHTSWNVICWYWSIMFLKTNVTAPVYQEILEHFMLPSADQLFKDADFIFQQDLAPTHTAKSTKSWLNDHGMVLVCLTGQQTHQTRGKWETRDKKNADELKATVKETWVSIPPQQFHKLITSIAPQLWWKVLIHFKCWLVYICTFKSFA